ncbi:MAG: sigma-54-dependent Fis family transcriptional regulator [Gemmatimonadota bacterium]|nr:MAG: sigma-54-dependent Fis family transcriptional regulator [Gemmatimonadota bacterium]
MRNTLNILLVDDEINMLEVMRDVLEAEGHCVTTVSSGYEALEKCEDDPPFDLIITDLKMPRMNGIELLEKVREKGSPIPVVILTAHGTIGSAVEAVKKGAYDYILKPFKPDEIFGMIGRILERKNLLDDNLYFQKELSKAYGFETIIGTSSVMQDLFENIEKVARTDASVVLRGESGTGKELLAHIIHYASRRKNKRFVKVSCASLAEGVLESELFGHEKGAFTSAVTSKPGRFEVAHGGTLFLDEIGDIPLTTQIKLLRVLQTKEFERVGGTRTIKVDVRLISATNQDLEEKKKQGTFREDLFYRLHVVPILVPPLRERSEDIPILSEYFLRLFSDQTNKRIRGFSQKALELMSSYPWPGNVRELRNYIERATVFCQSDVIKPEDLPPVLMHHGDTGRLSLSLESRSLCELEKKLIRTVLEEAQWNLTKAAGALQISRGTLYSKLKKYGLTEKA